MHLNHKLSKFIANLFVCFIFNKEKRRRVRQNINLYFGNVSGGFARFVAMIQEKNSGLLNNAKNIDTLFIGDSHTEYGCLPFLISKNAYNYAFTANGLYEIYRTLQFATEKCRNIKKIIFLTSFWQCGYSEIRGSGSKWCQILDRLLEIEYDYSLNKKHDYNLTAKALNILLSGKGNTYTNNKKIYCQGYNFAGLEIFPLKPEDRFRAAHHFKIYTNYKSELPWLQKICDWCKEHNQELYLINSPERSDYKQVISELSTGEDILKEIRDIAQQNNVFFYNFNADFNDDDFIDCDHLNFNGAVKMTRKIAEVIK